MRKVGFSRQVMADCFFRGAPLYRIPQAKVSIKMSQDVQLVGETREQRWLVLVFWLAVVAAVGAVGSWVTLPQIPGWYTGLAKPWFTPPNAVFGPAWTTLYLMMAVAVWLVARVPSSFARTAAIALFIVQLCCNAIWSPVFFGLHAPKLGLAVIAVLLVSLAATIAVFWRISRLAALLLVPYLAWVCYATALNGAIVALN
jgi:benzodiazapine receptor